MKERMSSPIKEIQLKLVGASNPVMQKLHSNQDFNTLLLGFNKGSLLKNHTAKWPSKLTILSGNVVYRTADKEIKLTQFDTLDIPTHEEHNVYAEEDALCLLTQSNV